jgi:hypothetical protein
MATNTKPAGQGALRRTAWSVNPWKPGDFRTPSSGSAAKDVFRHLPSKFDPPPAPTQPPKEKR